MKAVRVFLALAVLAFAGGGMAQSQRYTASSQGPASPHVIVPWTRFGHDPPATKSVESAQASAPLAGSEAAGPAGATAARINGSDPPGDAPNADPPPDNSVAMLYEADISKEHPHPPQPVDLPLAGRDATPILTVLPERPDVDLQVQAPGSKSGGATGLSAGLASKVQDHSPESQIADLTSEYEEREAERKARRAQLEAAAAHDPSTRAIAQIEVTRLLLEGEKDRGATSQQIAKAFASLGEELDNRARRVRDLVESRDQTAVTAEAELDQLNQLVPRRELALRNLAMLPASDQTDQIIHGLNTELAQEEDTRRLDRERSQEARSEVKALQAEANALHEAAQEARRRSSKYADAAQSAQVNENLLADRLEYSVARMRTADLLTGVSKALNHSDTLKENIQMGPLPAAGTVSTPGLTPTQTVDKLRDCIRRTGDPDACRAKGDQ
jgi:hypothetical protein